MTMSTLKRTIINNQQLDFGVRYRTDSGISAMLFWGEICSEHSRNYVLFTEILCTEKNSQSKLCREVESMREQLTAIPRLEKKLEELQKALLSTSDTIITLSRGGQLKTNPKNEPVKVG